jgi:hypothetical protein
MKAEIYEKKKGFDSTSARKVRLYHACWIEFLDKWAERTKEAIEIPWADGQTRWTRLLIGGVMGDQQEGDKYTGEPCVCHRCYAPRKRYLETADFEAKTMRKVRQKVELAAAGMYLKGRRSSTRVVKWDPDGRNVRPGPGIIAIMFIMHILYIISIKCHLDFQECDIMSHNEKRRGHICSSTRFG